MTDKLKDLGWANDWHQDPDILKKCNDLKHSEQGFTDVHSNYVRCVTTVTCLVCGYTYSIDSSD